VIAVQEYRAIHLVDGAHAGIADIPIIEGRNGGVHLFFDLSHDSNLPQRSADAAVAIRCAVGRRLVFKVISHEQARAFRFSVPLRVPFHGSVQPLVIVNP